MPKPLLFIVVQVVPQEIQPDDRASYKRNLGDSVRKEVRCFQESCHVSNLIFLNGPQLSCVSINHILFGHKAVIPATLLSQQRRERHTQLPERGWDINQGDPSLIPPQIPERRSDYNFPSDCRKPQMKKARLSRGRWEEVAKVMVKSLVAEAEAHDAQIVLCTLPPELFAETMKIIAPGEFPPVQESTPVSVVSVFKGNIRPVYPAGQRMKPANEDMLELAAGLRELDRSSPAKVVGVA
jgi:hypothetical protein